MRDSHRAEARHGLVAYVLLAVVLLGLGAAAAADDYTQWGYRKSLTLNTKPSAANVTGTVSQFPVLVRLNPGNFDGFANTLAGGADIRFASATGTHLRYQKERWADGSSNNDTADIWVLVPTINGNDSAGNQILMYWGKTGAADSSSGSAVFALSNGFGGVWHLGEQVADGAAGIVDATGNGNTGTPSGFSGGGTGATGTPALIGKGAYFDTTASSDLISVGSGSTVNPPNNMTASVWYRTPIVKTGSALMFNRATNDATCGWMSYALWINYWGGGNRPEFVWQNSTPGVCTDYTQTSNAANSVDAWHHVAGVRNGSNLRIFVDGVEVNNATVSPTGSLLSGAWALKFGGENTGSLAYKGYLDEVRVDTVARSPDWIKLCYQSQRAQQTLVQYGVSQVNGPWARTWNGSQGTGWATAANWTPAGVPGTLDTVVFTSGAAANCLPGANREVGSVSITTGFAGKTLDLQGYTLSVNGSFGVANSNNVLAASANGCVVDIKGSGNLTNPNYANRFNTVKVAAASKTTTVTGDIRARIVQIGAGTFATGTYGFYAGDGRQNGDKVIVADPSAIITGSGTINLAGTAGQTFSIDGFNAPSASISLIGNGPIQLVTRALTLARLDIPSTATFDANGQNVTVNGEINIGWSTNAATFRCGSGTITCQSLYVEGTVASTLDLGSSTLNCSGNYTVENAAQVVVPGTSKVVFNGTSGTRDITLTGQSLGAIDVNGSGATYRLKSMLSCAALTVKAGTLTTSDGTTVRDLTCSSLDIQGGNLTANSSTIAVSGNCSVASGTGRFTMGTSTLVLAGSATIANPDWNNRFWNVTQQNGVVTTLNNHTFIDNNFVTGNSTSTVKAAGAYELHVKKTGGPGRLVNNGCTWGGGTGVLTIIEGSTYDFPAGNYGNCNIQFYHRVDRGLAGDVVTTGNVQLFPDYQNLIPTLSLNGHNLTCRDFTIGVSDVGRGKLMVTAGSALTCTGSLQVLSTTQAVKNAVVVAPGASPSISVAGNWTTDLAGGFEPQQSTVTLNGTSGTQLVTTNGGVFHHLAVQTSGAAVALAGNLSVNGDFSVVRGTSTTLSGLAGKTITVGGNATLNGRTGSLLNLNPASAWTIAVTGTLNADSATIANSNASVSMGGASGACVDGGGNTNWYFGSDADNYSQWVFHHSITLNTTSSGANVTGNVQDFPLLLRVSPDNVDGLLAAASDGRDIRFTDQAGRHLFYQLESWDSQLRRGDIWVRVPQILGNNSSQTISMHWGKPDATARSNPSGVFQTASGHNAVWHLSQNVTDGQPGLLDATNNHANLSPVHLQDGGGGTTAAPSLADGGVYLDAVNDGLESGDNDVLEPRNNMTLSCWVKLPRVPTGGNFLVMSRANESQGGPWAAYLLYLDWVSKYPKFVWSNASGNTASVTADTNLQPGLWHHLAAVRDGGALKLYIDGRLSVNSVFTSGAPTGELLNGNWGFHVGAENATSGTFKYTGFIDELRVDAVARSADYVKLCYETQKPAQSMTGTPDLYVSRDLNEILTQAAIYGTNGQQVVVPPGIYNLGRIEVRGSVAVRGVR